MGCKKEKDYLTNDENEYIRTHEDSVTIMTEENAQIADKEQERKPILLITTQRYFRWEKDEIKEYLHWGPVGQYKRSMIIFDEMPMLNEVRDVSIKTLNDIDSALWLGLDDEVDLRDKLWCINQWEHFRNWFEKMLFEFEQDRDISKFYFEPDRHNITEDDERFLRIINGNKGILNRNKYFKEYQDILTVKKLMDTWGIFSHRNADTDAYENKITVYFDNRDKVTGLDAKIIVLDGTGKISPIYDEQDYIEIEPEEAFLRPLSYLTIKIGDYPTSRRDFFMTRDTIPKRIKMYLKKAEYDPEIMYYFTYKRQRSKFHQDTEHTAHFGDIKGKNQFIDATVITQVGLNSLQPPQYLAHVLARYDDLRLPLVGKSHKETQASLERILNCKEYQDFSSRHLLADVDQCLFRTAIRNVKNSEEVTYFLFYKTAGYKQLTEKIEKRYGDLSANVLIISRDEIDKAWEEGRTAEGRIWAWINREWKKNPMKRKDVLEELEMNGSTFDSTIRRSKNESGTLWKEICVLKEEAVLHGYKKCYYMKKVVQND